MFPVHVLVLNSMADATFDLNATVGAGGPDDSFDDNTARSPIQVVRHPATTALSIHADPVQSTVLPGGNAAIALDVRNDGPDTAHNVTVRAWYDEAIEALISGTGWTCSARSCTRASLAPGQSAPIAFSFPTPVEAIYLQAFTVGAKLSFDPIGMDNLAETRVGVGDAATWRRILLPLSFAETPGAFGSRWKTEIRGLIDSATPVELEPRVTCARPVHCPSPPLHRPFDLPFYVTTMSHLPAQFLYVRAEYEPKLTLNLRVRDLTRTAETWGTEVPAVREQEWRTTAIVLAPLPVDPLFRLTLRAYDFDPVAGHRVAFHIYAGDETEPRITLVKELTVLPWTVTTALLPAYPGYIQFDPLAEAGEAMAGAKTAWIRVEPLTPGLRFWAFASVTNNPTGHVTTVTPQ